MAFGVVDRRLIVGVLEGAFRHRLTVLVVEHDPVGGQRPRAPKLGSER